MVLVLPHLKLKLLLVVIISEEHEEQKRVVSACYVGQFVMIRHCL